MEKEFDHYEVLKWELFEKLFPKMIYYGGEGERDDFFRSLREDGQRLAFMMFEALCMEDKVDCPYKTEDFQAEAISRGNIGMVKIQPPECSPKSSGILRAYVAYSEKADAPQARLYFFIKRFAGGEAILMYADQKGEALKVEELTGHMGDIEYEYWRVAASYARIICDRVAKEQKTGKEWSRDWAAFDWEAVREKLDGGRHDIGITKDEWLEYMQWVSINDPAGYETTVMCIFLKEAGFSDKEAVYFSEHMDELAELFKKYGKLDRDWRRKRKKGSDSGKPKEGFKGK